MQYFKNDLTEIRNKSIKFVFDKEDDIREETNVPLWVIPLILRGELETKLVGSKSNIEGSEQFKMILLDKLVQACRTYRVSDERNALYKEAVASVISALNEKTKLDFINDYLMRNSDQIIRNTILIAAPELRKQLEGMDSAEKTQHLYQQLRQKNKQPDSAKTDEIKPRGMRFS